MNTEARQHFESAFDIMDNLKAVKGVGYSRTVEVALNTLKARDLFGILLKAGADHIGDEAADKLWFVFGVLMAKQISLAGMNAELDTETAGLATEIVGWAQKIRDAEDEGAAALLKDQE